MNEVHGILESTDYLRPLKDSVRDFERKVITEALHANGDDKRKVAKLLGISLSSLYRKITEPSNGEDLGGLGVY